MDHIFNTQSTPEKKTGSICEKKKEEKKTSILEIQHSPCLIKKSQESILDRTCAGANKEENKEIFPSSYDDLVLSKDYSFCEQICDNFFTEVDKIKYHGNYYALKYIKRSFVLQEKSTDDNLLKSISLEYDSEEKAFSIMKNAHDNVIHLLKCYKNTVCYTIFVMPYFPDNLSYFLKKKPGLNISFCFNFSLQITDALHFIHKNGIIHGDMRPQNILIHHDSSGKMIFKIIDFGGCVFIPYSTTQVFKIDKIIGSYQYRAPEAYHCSSYCFYTNHTFDNYGLGIMIQEQLTHITVSKDTTLSHDHCVKIRKALDESIDLAKQTDPVLRISSEKWNAMLRILNKESDKD